MKKIVSSIIAGSLLFGVNLYKKEENPIINLKNNLILKTSTKNPIKNIDIDLNKFLVAEYSKIKILNINTKEIEKTIPLKDILEVRFSKDHSKLIALTKEYIYILNAKNYQLLTKLKGKYEDIDEKNNILAMIGYNANLTIFNLKTGEEIAKIDERFKSHLKLSPNAKKVAIYDGTQVLIYDLNSKELLNKFTPNNIRNIEWADNTHIFVLNQKYDAGWKYRILKYDIITANITNQTPKYNYIDNFTVINNHQVLIVENKDLFLFDFNINKTVKQFSLIENRDVKEVLLNNNLLATANYKNAYLFKTNIQATSTTPKSTAPKVLLTPPQPITKVVEKPVIVEKKVVVEKKVYVDSHKNIKPTVEIYASKTSGFVPLTVNFKIIANDEDGKIVSYYINFAGKEAMAKGNPKKSFNYTFTKPGTYNIMVAVKDNKGAIATKKISIKVREESFEDFKKGLMGN